MACHTSDSDNGCTYKLALATLGDVTQRYIYLWHVTQVTVTMVVPTKFGLGTLRDMTQRGYIYLCRVTQVTMIVYVPTKLAWQPCVTCHTCHLTATVAVLIKLALATLNEMSQTESFFLCHVTPWMT